MTAPRATPVVMAASLLAAAVATPALSQGMAVNVEAGYFSMTAARASANAVFGSSGGATFGGELSYVSGNGSYYLAAGGRYFKKTGEMVFVADRRADVFRLGHPLTARIIPAHVTLGRRFMGNRSFVPYVGVGIGLTSYHEESTVGGLVETNSSTKASGRVAAGIEVGRGKVRLAAEIGYSAVPGAIGVGGVANVYDETDVGGLSVVGKLVFASRSRESPAPPPRQPPADR